MNEQTDRPDHWPTVEIVVLSWNGRSLLQQYLPALTRLDYPAYQIIVVDNGSTDDTIPFLASEYHQVRLIANDANLGFSRGINPGLRQTSADVVVLLNNDVEVRPNWLTELVRPLHDQPDIGITGAKLYFPDGRTLQHAGAMLEQPLAIGRHRFYRQPDTGQADELCDVDYVTGAAMAVHRRVINQIGLLDESFAPFYYEETDYCTRARNAGFRVVYVPTAVAIHHESLTFNQIRTQQFHNLNLNRLRYVLRHTAPPTFLHTFIPAEAADMAARELGQHILLLRQVYLEAMLALDEMAPTYTPDEQRAALTALAGLANDASHLLSRKVKETEMRDYWLLEKAEVTERPFQSPTPVIGPLLAWFRTQWNNVATKWYVRPLLAQQNQYNQLAAQLLADHDGRLIAQDHDQTTLTRQTAELTLQIKQMNHLLQSIDQRLARLEQQPPVQD